jgi:5'-nucleotidase
MKLLLSNDDGIDASGIQAMERAAAALGTVWVVAPEAEMSATSHALTMHKPLRARPRGEGRWAVSGLLPARPDLVISGINRGSNLGNDVFYSGTVAAAMEACFNGLTAVAMSLHIEAEDRHNHWETAAEVAVRVARGIAKTPLPAGVLLNVNVPNVSGERLRGVKVTALGQRRYAPLVDVRTDPRGRHYYWIGGAHEEFLPIEGTDGPAIEQGWATVTPFRPDLTATSAFDALRTWADE